MTSISENKGYLENGLKPENLNNVKDKDALIQSIEKRIAELTEYLNELKK